MNIGIRVEEIRCYGFKPGETLSAEERASIVEFARSFEECNSSESELSAMSDKDLVYTAYGAMADYASGQI